jgi:hypothetical protein
MRTFSPALAALLFAALPACGSSAEPQAEPAANAAAAAPPSAPSANAATAANAAAPASAPACAVPERVELDVASFEGSGVPAFPPQRLEAFRQSAAAAFRLAAQSACAAGEIEPARLAAVRRLLVQSASGATETAFYEDAEGAGAGTLVFQYVFAEDDLAVPEAADIRMGLICWTDPERAECAERAP